MALGALIAVVCLAALILGVRLMESRSRQPETRGDYRQRYAYDNVIEVDGQSYRQRKELTTILLMGVDKDSTSSFIGNTNGGQSDFLRLLIMDPEAKTISQLAIDRDTMTPVNVTSFNGTDTFTKTLQICLSHSYGDGHETSCENTVEAVSNLLLGTEITHYASLFLDGISELNDWAGGVTVTLAEDFSYADPAMTQGATVTLMGDQAEYYVRGRMQVGDGMNTSRMGRQSEYLHSLAEKVGSRLREDRQQMTDLYEVLKPFLVTDFSTGRIVNEAWAAREYTILDPIDIPSTHSRGATGVMECHVDDEALERIVIDLFYEAV